MKIRRLNWNAYASLKITFLTKLEQGRGWDYFLIITGPFMKSTLAQFSTFDPSPPWGCSLLAWPSPSSPTHSSPYGDWWMGWDQFWTIQGGGGLKSSKKYMLHPTTSHQPTLEENKDIRDGTNLDSRANW